MSGSGGDSGGSYDDNPRPTPKPRPTSGGGGGGGGGQDDPCAIEEVANLNSPNRAVIGTLRVGDILQIVYQPGPPQLLLAQTTTGQTAGSITSPSMLQIIDCIENSQVRYEAEVVSNRGAVVQVRIYRR